MAKQQPKQNRKAARRGRPTGASPALIALVGVVAMLAAYFAQAAVTRGHSATGGLRVSEVMSANASTLTLDDGAMPDWIEIENTSDRAVDLTGWSLVRESKPADAFAFPSGALQPGERLVVYADGSGAAKQADGWHAPFKLPAAGDNLALLNPRGEGVDLVEIPALGRDQAYCRDASGAWQITDYPTPGDVNRAARFTSEEEAARAVVVVPGALEISEAMSDNATFFADENGEYPDYIEIHNISGQSVNLEGWSLSDNQRRLKRWQFPAVTLPADGYIAVHCSGESRTGDPAHLHASFRLSNKGEEIFLTDPNGATVSRVKLPAMAPDQAYSLLETGWTGQYQPSPGQPNTPAGADAAGEAVRALNRKNVYITEVLASSSRSEDWIELYNGSAEAVDLSGFGLSNNAGRPRRRRGARGA